ncbi:MAG TPA: hypothetical protein VI122_04035 [Thermoleophilaceae bacterium]
MCTLVAFATRVGLAQLESAVNEADKRDLIDPESLRSALENLAGRPGVAILRELLTGAHSDLPTRSSNASSS